jgi:hypothetical protein
LVIDHHRSTPAEAERTKKPQAEQSLEPQHKHAGKQPEPQRSARKRKEAQEHAGKARKNRKNSRPRKRFCKQNCKTTVAKTLNMVENKTCTQTNAKAILQQGIH